jgi:hypothetical protein
MIKPGTIEDGYIFVGGDPAQQANWRPAQTLKDADATQLTKARDAAARAQTFGGYAEQFLERNRETGTGPLGFVQGWFPGKSGANIGAMNALQSRAAPMLRQAGDPSTKEMEMYKRGFPSPQNWGGANLEIVKDIRKDTAKAAARASWLEKWGQTTGSLAGADAAFENWWSSRQSPKAAPLPGPAPRPKSGASALSDDELKKALGF